MTLETGIHLIHVAYSCKCSTRRTVCTFTESHWRPLSLWCLGLQKIHNKIINSTTWGWRQNWNVCWSEGVLPWRVTMLPTRTPLKGNDDKMQTDCTMIRVRMLEEVHTSIKIRSKFPSADFSTASAPLQANTVLWPHFCKSVTATRWFTMLSSATRMCNPFPGPCAFSFTAFPCSKNIGRKKILVRHATMNGYRFEIYVSTR